MALWILSGTTQVSNTHIVKSDKKVKSQTEKRKCIQQKAEYAGCSKNGPPGLFWG